MKISLLLQVSVSMCLLAMPFAAVRAAPCPSAIEIPSKLVPVRIVIFGEIHGTNEAPKFVARYLCSLLQVKDRIVLGLEIPATDQQAITTYLDSGGDAESQKLLLANRHWQAETPDGRSSAAMFELIEQARRLRSSGKNISILAFDAWPKDRTRDLAMGENIRTAVLTSPDASFVILVGNLHAMNERGKRGKPDFEPMAFSLRDLAPVSLNIDYSSGTAWSCRALKTCGEVSVPGMPTLFPRSVGISLRKPLLFSGFDGEYFVGQVSASPPAIGSGSAAAQ